MVASSRSRVSSLLALLLLTTLSPDLQAQEVVKLSVEQLSGKSFRFSWKQGATGGFNGVMILAAGGRIRGINSPNESAWALDPKGRLVLEHRDGQPSTTFETCVLRDGKLCLEGPFHLREGITHLLEETAQREQLPPDRLDEGLPEELLFSSQKILCLDPGEEYLHELRDGRKRTLRLISVDEQRDSVVKLIRRAEVRVAIDGREHLLVCAPYTMPSVIDGLRIQVDTTSGFVELPKRVQFSLWDAADPIVDLEKFGFPLRDYRIFSHGIQCYGEPVHLGRGDGDPQGAVFYHSYGIDFAGLEGEQDVLACVAGRVIRLVPDGVIVNIIDDAGLIWEYHHLASIARHLEVGRRVRKGEKIGVLGRSGPSGNFSHLHVGAFLSPGHMHAGKYTRRLNYYPWMVAASRVSHGQIPYAVAGPHQVALTGERAVFDAVNCIAGDAAITEYRWVLPGGEVVAGAHAEWTSEVPGSFVATLCIRDAKGREDVDFCRLKVFTKGAVEPGIPAFFMTSIPTLEARAGEPMLFKIWLHGAEEHPFRVSFGDGKVREGCESFEILEHVYRRPGLYIVAATAEVEGVTIEQRRKVVVRPAWSGAGTQRRREAASREAIVRDWMQQDYMSIELPPELEREKEAWREEHLRSPDARLDAPVLEKLECFVSERDSIVEQRMTAHVLDELAGIDGELRSTRERLIESRVPGNDPRWQRLYLAACELRREQRLTPLTARWRRFVFCQHPHVPGSWKYTEGLSNAQQYRFFRSGAALEVLELDGPYGEVHRLIEDREGTLRNPDVSLDGERILFSWKKSDREDDFHLYEMAAESGEIRQLTHGLGLADYEGAYLPTDEIVFSSTRCIQTVDCNWVEVSNLFMMAADGGHMRRVAYDQVHTVFPTLTDDGRILYTRWDYNDRAQIYTQPLFEMNSDGTNQREFYGGSSWFPTNIIHARKIPGTSEVVAIITGHHTPAHGKLGIIDPAKGRQEGRGIELIAPVREADPIRVDMYGMRGHQFQYPYPVDRQRFLVSLALPEPNGALGRFNLYLIDREGRRELLAEGDESGEGIGCRQVVPLAPREIAHRRASTVDYRQDSGTVFMQDIYQGPGLEGIPRGTIKRLRVVALEYRAAGVGHAQQEGRGGFADVSTPIAVGNGSWDVKVVHGSAKVHEDGSAFFEAPARKPLYFQALDEDGIAVQTMRSWTTLQPGEMQSCVGCHEHKNSAPRAGLGKPLAMQAGPQQLDPFYGPPRGFSYTREVQPILDRRCALCHDGREDVPYDLRGEMVLLPEMKRRVSRSYLELTHTSDERGDCNHALVNWIDSMSEPSMLPPLHRGASKSRLIEILQGGHEGVRLSAEELEKIACWIDLLVPFCGDYLEHNTWSEAELDRYGHHAARRRRQEVLESANIKALIGSRKAGR